MSHLVRPEMSKLFIFSSSLKLKLLLPHEIFYITLKVSKGLKNRLERHILNIEKNMKYSEFSTLNAKE